MKCNLAVNQPVGFNVAQCNVETVTIDHLNNVVRITYRRITAGGVIVEQGSPLALQLTFQQFESAWAGSLQATVFALLGAVFGTTLSLAGGEQAIP